MTRRRKYIILAVALLVVYVLLNGLYQSRKNAASPFDKPEYAAVVRGDLNVPISATGTVEPASQTQIKCKSSGTVQEVYFEPGDMVRKGDLLIKLDPVDENRSVESAKADVARATANLILSQSELEQTQRDWPTKVGASMAGLVAARASLQEAVVNFKKMDKIRQAGQGAQSESMDVEDISKIKPVDLDPKMAELDAKSRQLIQVAGKLIAIAEYESASTDKLIEYGKSIINQHPGGGYWEKTSTTFTEYQGAVIGMWQAQAKILAAMTDVRTAVNLRIMIDQAHTKIELAKEAVRMSNVALEQAEQRLKDTQVYAPNDGLVQEVSVKKGQIISSGITTFTGGTPLLTLADVGKLYVVSDVDEADIGRVRDLAPEEHSSRLGYILRKFLPVKAAATKPAELTAENEQEMKMLRASNNVDVTVDAFREDTFTGKVDRVDPNPKNVNNIVTYNVRILLTSPNRNQLMLGMHANVKFTSRKVAGILKVPNEAIQMRNEERGVFIDGADGKPQFIPVKVGLTDGMMIELKTDKLKAGEKVYTKLPAIRNEDKSKDEQ